MKTEWEKYPILSVLVIEIKLFHTTEEGSVEDKKFISPKRFIREKIRLQKVGVTLYVKSRPINDKVLPIEKRRAASSNPSTAQCQKFKK